MPTASQMTPASCHGRPARVRSNTTPAASAPATTATSSARRETRGEAMASTPSPTVRSPSSVDQGPDGIVFSFAAVIGFPLPHEVAHAARASPSGAGFTDCHDVVSVPSPPGAWCGRGTQHGNGADCRCGWVRCPVPDKLPGGPTAITQRWARKGLQKGVLNA
jgi:hypothetical protein